jgi:hypothetical protein
MMQFFMAHQAALCTLAYVVMNEFVKNASFIKGNSIVEAVFNYAFGWLKAKAAPPQG